MAGWINFLLITNAIMIAITESELVPVQPISVMVDAYGKPIMFLRDRRAAMHPYPQRTMMFTGYYKPIRRSNNGGQATGVFAQGNAVSGEAYFSGLNTPYFRNGPRPIVEPEVPSTEVYATPEGTYNINGQEQEQSEDEYLKKQFQEGGQQQPEDEEYFPQDSSNSQPQPEQIPLTTEIAQPAEESTIITSTKAPIPRPKVYNTKKTQKRPVTSDTDDDYDEDETDEEDDEPIMPFIPFKGNKRRQRYPNLSNFFPMIFNYPKIAARAGASGSPPGTVTAVANSYSRSKGGVASAVANAFGGPPSGKKRRSQQTEE